MSKPRKPGQIGSLIKFLFYTVKTLLWAVLQGARFTLAVLPRLLRASFMEINKRLRLSITFKTTITYTLLFSLILLILGTGLTGGFAFFLYHATDQSLARDSQLIEGFIAGSTDIPRDKLAEFAAIENVVVTLYDQQGQIVYSTREGSQPPGASSPTRLSPTTSVNDYLHFEAPIALSNGISKIVVSQSLAAEMSYLAVFVTALVLCLLFALILTIVIGGRTSRKMLRPIDNMTRTARSIPAGDLNARLDVVDSHDELKELAETFNELLDRIQTSFEQQNTFISDASHELRTPIAVIQGYANLLQRWGKADKAVLEESIEAIKSEADNMKDLVEKLLFMAGADKKERHLERTPFALNVLLDEVLKESRIIDSQHRMMIKANAAVMIAGDRGLIKQALRILIDNGRKYTPEGGIITLSSSLIGRQALITIEDTGMGIAAEDLPHIFDRFYKADKSRTRGAGGAGLGLSIAKRIIEQHQGAIQVESIINQGTKASITLPALD